jgi:O-methyltransferase
MPTALCALACTMQIENNTSASHIFMAVFSTPFASWKSSIEARLRYPMVRKVRAKGLTYLSNARLISILKHVDDILKRQESPLLVEFGVALGGSAILMSDTLRRAGKGDFLGYDMFGLIPAPSEKDEADAHQRYQTIVSGRSSGLKGGKYYGYESDLRTKVAENFAGFGLPTGEHIKLIAGDFRETFQPPPRPIDLMHIDCDWHESVVFCLEVAKSHLRAGGYVLVDDYNDYKGCKAAVDAFLSRNIDGFLMTATQPHAIIRRVSS